MRFRLAGLSPPSMPTLYLKDQRLGDNTIYPELLLKVGVVHWNKFPGCWLIKKKKNSPLIINNYLLKHNRIIYVYIYRIVSIFVVFEWEANEVLGWCSLSTLLILAESEISAGEALVRGDISFLILLSSAFSLDIFSLLTQETYLFIEDSTGNNYSRLGNQSQIISYSSTSFWSTCVGRVSRPRIRF